MKKILKAVAGVLAVFVLLGAGVYLWASRTAARKLARTYVTHTVDFPIPFPLSAAEIQRRHLTPEAAQQAAHDEALERGTHLIEARYGCIECHGRDLGGGVMVDDPAIGRLLGPNLTSGPGSRTVGYRAADWDHIVRHGILPDGRPAAMPSEDFRRMSDQELSDIVVYVQSQVPVDHEVPHPTLGPLGKVLLATGKLVLSADVIDQGDRPHMVTPPATAVTVEFGHHLAAVCSGCHREDLAGGPIVGGDPSWPPAMNLTPDATALGGWTFEQFVAALRQGMRPDGTALRTPMSAMVPFAQKMSDVELEALWTYLRSVPAVASRD